jgi:hypothetical protein
MPVTDEVSDQSVIVLKIAEDDQSGEIPTEGFAIRTEPKSVVITAADQNGLAWGMYEFLERFVGVRFYWPDYGNDFGHSGTSIVERESLLIDPVHLTDAPAFPKRERWPSGGPRIGEARMSDHDRRMRCGDTWPVQLIVHAPHGWDKIYKESRPEIFQLRKDGRRDFNMLCYGDPLTLKTYLEEIALQRKKQETDETIQRGRAILQGNSITVSPADAAVACRCEDCRALWDKEGCHYGTASKVLGTFVANLGREVQERWPDMTVIFLPYKNCTMAPKGIDFTDNVQVQICGMPGLAQYKDSAIWDRMQSNVDSWVNLTGNRIQNWHYSCWPANRTEAVYLFPHTIQKYYRHNRDKTVGTFINGVKDHWPRQHLSLYVWLKVLWDPDVHVDAIIDTYCRRMYGPAAGTMRQVVDMLIEGWEGTEWSPHVLSPKTVYEQSYPREDVLKIKNLLETAYDEAAGNELVTRRLDYWSLEVFIPYESMDGAVRPGTGVEWHGNFTRHRVTDRSNREYQAYNVTEGAPSHNQNAFGPIQFIEQ